jgi:hypothetical protein
MRRFYSKVVFLVGCLVLWIPDACCQYKFEREYRINRQEVPLPAIQWMDSLMPDTRIRWFVEESQLGRTFEAKCRWEGSRFSIEFDSSGIPLDIEKKVNLEDLKVVLLEQIYSELDTRFKIYRITKVQAQYPVNNETMYDLHKDGSLSLASAPFFELVIHTKDGAVSQAYEVLLNSRGELEEIFAIVERPTTNLEF